MRFKDTYDDHDVYKAQYMPSYPNTIRIGRKVHRIYSLYVHCNRGQVCLAGNYIRYRKAWYALSKFQ